MVAGPDSRFAQAIHAVVGSAQRTHLAGLYQLAERFQGFLQRGFRIVRMGEIDVDMVGLEARQRIIDGGGDIGRRQVGYTLSAMQGKQGSFGINGEHKVAVSGNLIANNGDALLAAAVRGQGIIYQPRFIVGDAVARGDLLVLELDRQAMDLGGIHVLYPPDRRPPAKVRVMIDYLAEAFAGQQG